MDYCPNCGAKMIKFNVDVTDLDSNSIINRCDAGGKIGGWTIKE